MTNVHPERSLGNREVAPEALPAGAEVREERVETAEALQALATQTVERARGAAMIERERVAQRAHGAAERLDVVGAETDVVVQRQSAEADALAEELAARVTELVGEGLGDESGGVETGTPRHVSLWEKARALLFECLLRADACSEYS